MASFQIYDWIKGGFKVEDTSPQGLRELANNIIAQEETASRAVGTVALSKWAKAALNALNAAENTSASAPSDEQKAKYLANAAMYLTGQSGSTSGFFQGAKPKEIKARLREYENEVKAKMSNYASNIANEEAILSDPDVTDEQRAIFQARADKLKEEMASYASGTGMPAETLSEYQGIEQTPSGDWVPAGSNVGASKAEASSYTPDANTGESLGIEKQADGSYGVIGRTSGKVYGSFADQSQANAYATQIQSGATPDKVGAFSPTTTDSTTSPEVTGGSTAGSSATSGGYTSSILPEGYDLSNFTEAEIKQMEQDYLNAGNSPTVMDKIFQMQEITDEDMLAFYDEAKEFVSGKGSAYAQEFDRSKQSYQLELDYQAEERKKALELEKLQAIENRRNARASLEASGMTFSGEAARQLGSESAFTDDQIEGMLPEGTLQQEENIMTSSSKARFEKAIQDYARGVEETLGSDTLAGISMPTIDGQSIYTPSTDVRGSLERAQETDIQTKADELQAAETARRQELLAAEGGTTLQ